MGRISKPARLVAYAAVFLLLIVYIYPLFMTLAFSFKTQAELGTNPFGLPHHLQFNNYFTAWKQSDFGQALTNSIITTTISVILVVIISSMAAYPLARRNTKLSNVLFLFFLAGLIVPLQLNLIPLYKLVMMLGLMRKLASVIVLFITIGIPLSIFLYTSFIRSVPKELEEAGTIDGCSKSGIFFRIIFPLLRPVTMTVIILKFLEFWNEFFIPAVFLNSRSLRTVPVAIYSFMGEYANDWVHMFPMIVLGSLPVFVLYMFLQRYIIAGIIAGSVKG